MKERINWIDWGKALAVITVVFCHLPQSQEWFYYRYLQTCIISIFFFLSGYLKKDRGSNKENWKKYWHGLILPYIIYNALVYPYWLVKYYIQNSGFPDLYTTLRPVLGALLLEHENAFCEPLNGPLWYLPAILFMHILIDICRQTKFLHHIMLTLCMVFFFVYAANKIWEFIPNLTPIGIFSRLPIYYIGYVLGQKKLFRSINLSQDLIAGVLLLVISIVLFQWHLHLFYNGDMSHLSSFDFLLHITLFYPINICFVLGTLCLCKTLNCIHSDVIVNLSIGTLVIIGLHIVLVTIANYAFEHLLHIQGVICYNWYEALLLAFVISLVLYPVIIWGKKHFPVLIGR